MHDFSITNICSCKEFYTFFLFFYLVSKKQCNNQLYLQSNKKKSEDFSSDLNFLVLDTEVYSNTGGQSSKSSQAGSIAKFTAGGKTGAKKDLAQIAMAYGHVYVAQVAMGANPAQTIKAMKEAESYNGPSLIIAYAPCQAHGIKGGLANHQAEQKRAIDCGYFT